MRSPRRFGAIAVLLLTPVLAGCGEDDEPEDAPPTSSSPESPDGTTDDTGAATSPTTASSTAPAGLPDACDVLASEDVSAAFGVEFGPAEPGVGGTTENNVGWQSDNCDWEAEDLVEVQLALTGRGDFTEGEFTCPEPTAIASTVEPVADLGQSAWWERNDAPPLEATLRVCTEGYNFDIDLEYEDGVDFQGDPQLQSVILANTVLENLGS